MSAFSQRAILLLLFFLPIFCIAQFTDVTSIQNIVHQYPSGGYSGGMSFEDWDNDGWDDLTLTRKNQSCLFYKNNNGIFEPIAPPIPNTYEAKMVTWIDYDNDADKDLFITRFSGPSELFNNDGNFQFTNVSITAGFYFTLNHTYGHCWADYDRDGFLDVYICNHDFGTDVTNLLFRNNGDGTFSETTTIAGVSNGSQPTFQALWTDVNNDLWPDLMVINDLIFFPNALYINNGDGTFTDASESSGLDYAILAMGVISEDFENDGDLDLYISNDPDGNLFFKNNGDGTFTEEAAVLGIAIEEFCWASQMLDMQNDGFPDLHVCSSIYPGTSGLGHFYQNNGNLSFTDISVSSGLGISGLNNYSSAQADFNNDGYADLCVLRIAPFSTALFQNQGNTNHWIKIDPVGVVSNRDGVGAWISVWSGGIEYSRYTTCGESYLSQNSSTEIFGLGTSEIADSIRIQWPGGHVDSWYEVSANQVFQAVEGSSLIAEIGYNGDGWLCPNEIANLDAGPAVSHLWSNGFTGQILNVDSPGSYYCTVTTAEGFILNTDTMEFQLAPEVATNIQLQDPLCYGDSTGWIELQTEVAQNTSITWSNDLTGSLIDDLPAGTYSYTFFDTYNCQHSDEVNLQQPDSLFVHFSVIDASCIGESDGIIMVDTTNIPEADIIWECCGMMDDLYFMTAGNYSWTASNFNGCDVSGTVVIAEPIESILSWTINDVTCYGDDNGTAAVEISGNYGPYEIDWGGTDSLMLSAGTYEITITDVINCTYNYSFEVDEPEQLTGEITFTWDAVNEVYLASVEVSGGVPGYDYAWYNGQVGQEIVVECEGAITVTVTDQNGCWVNLIESCVGISEENSGFDLYPNPASHVVFINSIPGEVIYIFDLSGKKVFSKNSQNHRENIDLTLLSPGMYMVKVGDVWDKLLIQNH